MALRSGVGDVADHDPSHFEHDSDVTCTISGAPCWFSECSGESHCQNADSRGVFEVSGEGADGMIGVCSEEVSTDALVVMDVGLPGNDSDNSDTEFDAAWFSVRDKDKDSEMFEEADVYDTKPQRLGSGVP
eukprot:897292-Rhodomonas_salina.1